MVFALLAISLTVITGNPIYDAIGSIFIGVLLVIIAVLVGIEVKALLIGQGVEPQVDEKMRTFLANRDEVAKVFSLLTLQLDNDVMIAVKAKMSATGSAQELIDDINRIEAAFRETFLQVMWLFFEPDDKD